MVSYVCLLPEHGGGFWMRYLVALPDLCCTLSDLSQLLATAQPYQPTLMQHIHGRVRRVLVQHGWASTSALVESMAKPIELYCRAKAN